MTPDAAVRYAAVAQFYAKEAALLDERRLFDWVELFDDGATYRLSCVERIQDRPGRRGSAATEAVLVADDKDFLRKRAERLLETNLAHAERPPSMTRHLITNVLLGDEAGDGQHVQSSFAVFQSRLEADACTFYGRRADVLRPAGDGFLIAERRVTLDHSILARSITILF